MTLKVLKLRELYLREKLERQLEAIDMLTDKADRTAQRIEKVMDKLFKYEI